MKTAKLKLVQAKGDNKSAKQSVNYNTLFTCNVFTNSFLLYYNFYFSCSIII
jgi:hypothetical protein